MNRIKDYIAGAAEFASILLFVVIVVVFLSAILISRAQV
jgi:hypothetical protein